MIRQKHPSLYGRQRLLLALLQKFGGCLGNVNLQKYLFLFTETCQKNKSYEFVPYRFGCFSFQSYADRRKLVELGLLDCGDGWSLVSDDVDYSTQLDNSERKKLDLFHRRYGSIRGDNLVREVYRRFPYFATRSEIARGLMSAEEMVEIEKARAAQTTKAFFTIGYEGRSFENYLNRLLQNHVRVLCDVRKNPLSRKYGFSKKTLSETLGKLEIEYVHLPELGIVSDKRQSLSTHSDYERLFDEYEATTLKDNNQAVDRLVKLVNERDRIAITCFEAEQCMCHRGRVAAAISMRADCNFPISHI